MAFRVRESFLSLLLHIPARGTDRYELAIGLCGAALLVIFIVRRRLDSAALVAVSGAVTFGATVGLQAVLPGQPSKAS